MANTWLKLAQMDQMCSNIGRCRPKLTKRSQLLVSVGRMQQTLAKTRPRFPIIWPNSPLVDQLLPMVVNKLPIWANTDMSSNNQPILVEIRLCLAKHVRQG